MSQKDDVMTTSITVLIILSAFSWIGYAYIVGAETDRMILHPIVPLSLIPLLLSFRRQKSTKSIITVAVVLICIWLLVRLQNVFMPFIVGFSLAYVINVMLSGLQNIPLPKGRRLHLSRGVAILVLITLSIGILTFLSFGIVPQLIEQASAMKEGIVSFYDKVKDYIVGAMMDLESGEYPFRDRLPESLQQTIDEYVENAVAYVQEEVPSIAGSAGQIIGEILARLSSGLIGSLGQISSAFFIVIIFIYCLQPFGSLMERIKDVFPEDQRRRIVQYAEEIDKNMRAFLKGQLAIIVIISVISIIAYSIIRVPFALLVGLLAGLCNAIPTIGPILGGGIAVLSSAVGFFAGNYGPMGFVFQLILVIGITFGIQLLDNSLISPRIMSGAVGVHPLVVIFAVLLSASLIGVWGAVLAIPGIVIVKSIIKVSAELRAECDQ